MNCQKFEEQIVLFRELSPEERAQVKKHVASCSSCRAFFDSMTEAGGLLQKASKVVPELADPTGLTSRIMLQIEKQGKRPRSLTLQYVRYAMAAVSVFFIFFLGIELLQVPTQPLPLPHAHSKQVVLDNGKFRAGLRSKKPTNLLLMSGCVNPFRINKVDESCLRERLAAYKTFSN